MYSALIPYSHSVELYRACQARKMIVCPEDMGHNTNLMARLDYLVIPAINFFGLPGYETTKPIRMPYYVYKSGGLGEEREEVSWAYAIRSLGGDGRDRRQETEIVLLVNEELKIDQVRVRDEDSLSEKFVNSEMPAPMRKGSINAEKHKRTLSLKLQSSLSNLFSAVGVSQDGTRERDIDLETEMFTETPDTWLNECKLRDA
eukprot:Platyproteum_vivax@DN2410_c0_g1_i1.p1